MQSEGKRAKGARGAVWMPNDLIKPAITDRVNGTPRSNDGTLAACSNSNSGNWWVLRGSNPRPTPCKGAALPTELSTRGSAPDALTLRASMGRARLNPRVSSHSQSITSLFSKY